MSRMSDALEPVVFTYATALEVLAKATAGHTRRGRSGAVPAITGTPIVTLNAAVCPTAEPDPDDITRLADSELLRDLP